MSPTDTVSSFLRAVGARDVESALRTVDPNVRVNFYGLGVSGTGVATLRPVLADTARAFPDLLLTVRRLMGLGSSVIAELTIEGTQADTYAGAINQEKHLDLNEAWRFEVDDGRIKAIDAYWCQQQLYRRLGVKRFDQIAIV